MIASVIRWSIRNRILVLLLAGVLFGLSVAALRSTPVDALPDLSDTQVIIRTAYPGQAPEIVERQLTYPLTTSLLGVPGAATVRGYSFFGDSFVYVLFEDGTDPYWARSRVLEYLNQAAAALPAGVTPALGPDATGVGWVYEYALVDRSGDRDLAELRSLQDWYLRFELQGVEGVAEVATVGGFVRQYQVVADPERLRATGLSLAEVRRAIERGNREAGGSVIEMGEAEYMVRASGFVTGLEDLRQIPLRADSGGTVLRLADVAELREGPAMRRGIAELDGDGEVVGGIVVMRSGANALATIDAVKVKLEELKAGLPDGVEIVETYDRSKLIHRSIRTLSDTVLKELLIVALVCALFLAHWRSSLVVVISLPLGVLAAFAVMRVQGINANIMSLGGIAIAIGAMVDAAIVMLDNLHRHLEREPERGEKRWRLVADAAGEVGAPLFFSLLIITLSFLPVFTLEAEEGRLFAPLAFTKTWAMAAAAGLAVTLVPVLMGYLVRGRIGRSDRSAFNRRLSGLYRRALSAVLSRPGLTLGAAAVFVLSAAWPASQLGREFMPALDEGDLMYMPTTQPGLSIDKARELLQQTDRLIKTVPEVETVFGKIGRADTATDPAPLTMIETLIQFKPREQWRPGMTSARLRDELDRIVQVPGLTNAWVQPIKTRIDMLATGIKTPIGLKIAGPDLAVIDALGGEVEALLSAVEGTASVYAEKTSGGRYVNVDIDRSNAGRFGLNVDDIQEVVATAVGGRVIGTSTEGVERYPINLRYPQRYRDSVQQLRLLPVVTPTGSTIALADVATVTVADGPAVIKSENARPNGWVYIDIRDRDPGSYLTAARQLLAQELELPPGYSLRWSGQFEYMQRAAERLALVVPVTIAIIVVLLFMAFGRLAEVLLVLGTLPMALVGGVWFLYTLDYSVSVAVAVGFIALAGIAIELGVLMLVYLNQSFAEGRATMSDDRSGLKSAVVDGAVRRLRPIVMTVSATIAGLLPIMLSSGTGSEVMRRIAAPMVGGMLSVSLLALFVLPAAYALWQRYSWSESPSSVRT